MLDIRILWNFVPHPKILRIFKDLKSGSECSLIPFPAICLITFFWSIKSPCSFEGLTPPQQIRPYSRCDLNKELYMFFFIKQGNKVFTLEIAKFADASLFLTFSMWYSHVKNSSKCIPTNLKDLLVQFLPTLSTDCPSIWISSCERSRCSCVLPLNRIYILF